MRSPTSRVLLLFAPWAMSIICLYCVFEVVLLRDLLHSLKRVDIIWLVAAMLVTVVNLVLRGVRSGVILARSDTKNLLQITAISNIGLALNACLPGKLGEVARMLLLMRILRTSAGQALTLTAVERLTDLSILVGFGWLGLSQVDLTGSDYGNELMVAVDSIAMVSVVLVLVAASTSVNFGRYGKACTLSLYRFFKAFPLSRRVGRRVIRDSRQTVRHFLRASVGPWSLGLSLGMWLMVTASVVLVAEAMPSIELSLMSCLTIAALTTLASALPSAPGGWGTYEAVGIVVTKQIVPQSDWADIGAFIFASHMVQYLPILLIGLLSWIPIKGLMSFDPLVN